MNGWHVVWGMTAAGAIAAAACSSSSTGGACTFACASNNPMESMQSNNACSSCVESMCGSQGSDAFGSGWTSGDLCGGGACASLETCSAACACSDTTCMANCLT